MDQQSQRINKSSAQTPSNFGISEDQSFRGDEPAQIREGEYTETPAELLDQGCCGLGPAQVQSVGSNFPHMPYRDYTPIPGVIPPTQLPHFNRSSPATWCSPEVQAAGDCVIPATRPIIPVPVTQNIITKDTVVEVDQLVITEKVQPTVYRQEVYHEVPKLAYDVRERRVDIPEVEIEQVEQVKEVPVGFNFKVNHKWQEREVPRLFPKYCGPQDVIEIGIPQIQVVDKRVDSEIPLYIGEKYVEKEIIEDEGVEVVTYQYVQREEEVPVWKYRPVFDVQVSIPPPVVVPIPLKPQELSGGSNTITWEEYQRQRKLKKQCKTLTNPINDCKRGLGMSNIPMLCGVKLDCCQCPPNEQCCCNCLPDAGVTPAHGTASSPPRVQPGNFDF